MKKTRILIILILLGILLRIYYAYTQAYFVNDQGRDLLAAYKIAIEKKLTLIGPSSSLFTKLGNIPFGPYYYYILAALILVSKEPLFVNFFFIFLYLITCLFILKNKELEFSEKFIFLTLYSFSINSVIHTTFIWNLNMATLLGFILFLTFIEKQEKIIQSKVLTTLFGLCLGIVLNIHYGLLFLVIGVFLIYIKKNKKNLLPFILGTGLSFAPLVLFNFRHNQIILQMILDLPNNISENKLRINITDTLIQTSRFYFSILLNSNLIHLILSFLILFILLKNKRFYLNLFSFIFILTFLIMRRQFTYYLAIFMPFFFLSISTFFKNNLVKKLLVLIFIIISANNISRIIQTKENNLSLRTQKYITEVIRKNTKDQTIFISASPHDDDKRGVVYLLKIYHQINIDPKAKERFIICYNPNKCPKIKGKQILKKDQITVYKL